MTITNFSGTRVPKMGSAQQELDSRVLSDLGRLVAGVPVNGSVRFVDGSTREMPLAELTATLR